MDVKTDGSGEYYMMPIGQYFLIDSSAVTELDGAQAPTSLTKYFGSVELTSLTITAQSEAIGANYLIVSSERPTTTQEAQCYPPSFNTRIVETKTFEMSKAYVFTSDVFSNLGIDAKNGQTSFLIYVDFNYKCRNPKITPGFRNNNINLNFQSKFINETCSKKNKFSLEDEEKRLKDKLKQLQTKKKEYGI